MGAARARLPLAALLLALAFAVPTAHAAGPPQVGPAWTANVSESGAGLRAEVNPNGFAATYRFEFLPEAAYRANLAGGHDGFAGATSVPGGAGGSIASGSAFVTVAQAVSSLSVDTSYRFRVRATNGSGGGATTTSPSLVFSTEPTGSVTFMLDNRGWELVSPLDKGGGQIQGPGEIFGGGAIQAAAAGSAIAYGSLSSFGAAAPGAPPASQYLSARGSQGWSTANLTAPTVGGAYGEEPDGAPYRLFSPDLSRALMSDGQRCGEGGGCGVGYSARSGASALALSPEAADLALVGADPDLSHAVLSTCAALTPDATEAPGSGGCDPAQPNLYLWSTAGLRLLNLLPAASQGTPGAALAAPAGAVAEDGARAYFTLGGNLYLREGATTKQVGSVGGTFEAAATAGTPAFYTEAGHLYRYDAAGAGSSTDLTPAGGVTGVLGASAAGDRAYFQDGEALKSWRVGTGLATVAAAPDAAQSSNFPPATGTARITPDGTRLAFLSQAPLTGYDNRGSVDPPAPGGAAGVPQTEAFLYDATAAGGAGELICASCNPTGERPLGPSTIPGAPPNGTVPYPHKPRALSADGRRLFFDSADDLALRDRDRFPARPDPDVYEWEAPGAGSCNRSGGCVALISSGRSLLGASFLDASAGGADVYFLTSESLVGTDSGFADVYDAREGGGFAEPFRPIECVGDSCQFLPSEPEDPNPGTLVASAGNPPLQFDSPAAKTKRKACRKGFVRRKGKCVGKDGKRGKAPGKSRRSSRGGERR